MRGISLIILGIALHASFLQAAEQSFKFIFGSNIGKVPLEIIEIQTGSYLGEDDIVRFDDLYGRV